jgi:hypothetical protein
MRGIAIEQTSGLCVTLGPLPDLLCQLRAYRHRLVLGSTLNL